MWNGFCQAWNELSPETRAWIEGLALMGVFDALKYLSRKFPWFPQFDKLAALAKLGTVGFFCLVAAVGAAPGGPLKQIITEFIERFAAAVLAHRLVKHGVAEPLERMREKNGEPEEASGA